MLLYYVGLSYVGRMGDYSAVQSTAWYGAQVWLAIVRPGYGAATKSSGARIVVT